MNKTILAARTLSRTLAAIACVSAISITTSDQAVAQARSAPGSPRATDSGAAQQAEIAQPSPTDYRLGYFLPNWQTLHLHDENKVKESLGTLKQLGCVVQQRAHAGHIDLTFRCNEWKVLAIEDKAIVDGWVTWLKANGFDVSLTKVDPAFAAGTEIVEFRLVQWKRIHGDGSAAEAEMVNNLKRMGVEVVVEAHGNHDDISFRAPTWRSIQVADRSQAEQWMAWLKQVGFEAKLPR